MMNPSRTLQILHIVLYVLAGTVLLLGLIVGISLIASADRLVANAIMPLQLLGAEVITNMIAPMLTGFFINLGVITLILAVINSALVYAVGRLVGHTARLEERVRRLEAG